MSYLLMAAVPGELAEEAVRRTDSREEAEEYVLDHSEIELEWRYSAE
jgi:hypothetical protein